MECSNAYSHQWIQTLLMVKPRSITHTMKKGVHWGQTRNKTPIAPVRALQRLNGCTFLQRFAIPVRTQLIDCGPASFASGEMAMCLRAATRVGNGTYYTQFGTWIQVWPW